MPARKPKPRATCTLNELLNWVAHDNFSGPSPTRSEISTAIFGMPDDVEEIEIAHFVRKQSEDAAMPDILDALRNGEVSGVGHYSSTIILPAPNWRDTSYGGHAEKPSLISQEAWQVGVVDWEGSTLKTPSGEYIQIRFDRSDVLSLWKLSDEESASDDEQADLAPASDRIVHLDHNSEPYQEAVSALDKVIDEFKADHKLDNELGPEKRALIATLEAGRSLLDDTAVKVDVAVALLVEPLKVLVRRYDQAIVGAVVSALATSALGLILKLLGLVLS